MPKTPPRITLKKQSRSDDFTVGIDLGGTKVATALVNSKGRILAETTHPTLPKDWRSQPAEDPTPKKVREHIQYVVETMTASTLEVLAKAPAKGRLLGIGLASAGPMDVEKGFLNHPSNLRGWKTVPLVRLLKESLVAKKVKSDITFQNDAIAAALGEGWIGRAQGCETYAVITVGTGIGTGVILRGQPAQSRGMGSEWGHLLVNCSGLMNDHEDYEVRTVEGLASGTGLIARAKTQGFEGKRASDLAVAARIGNRIAQGVFNESSEALAALLYSLSLGFHPEKFVFSGGLLSIRDCFLPKTIELYKALMRTRYPDFLAPVQTAKLGSRAGVIGAARLPFMAREQSLKLRSR